MQVRRRARPQIAVHPVYCPADGKSPSRIASTFLLALTFSLALVGYDSFAPIIQLLAPEGSNAAIALRALIIILCIFCLILYSRRSRGIALATIPMFLFLGFYTLRLYDNFFLREFSWRAEPIVAFGFLIGAVIIPAVILSGLVQSLNQRTFSVVQVVMTVVFLAGLTLNWDALLAASQLGQASLEKLNPISLGATALYFALFLAISPTRGPLLSISKFILLGILIGIAAFAQARGPIVATGFAILVFGLVSQGVHRKYLIRATIVVAVCLALTPIVLGIDLVEFGLKRFFVENEHYVGLGIGASAQGRIVAWWAAWEQFFEAPLIGDRVFEPTLMHYPHNLFLESLISLGLLGTYVLLLHLSICARACLHFLRHAHASILSKFLALVFLKEFAQVQFSGAIWNQDTFWIASACLIALGATVSKSAGAKFAQRPVGLLARRA